MSDVLTFTPRPKSVAPAIPTQLTGPTLRVSLEEAAQTALDAGDRLIAVLDSLDGNADHDGGDAEPSLAAPENTEGSQVVYMRGGDQNCEQEEAAQLLLPEVEATPIPEATILLWRGHGNVISAAGVALLGLLERA